MSPVDFRYNDIRLRWQIYPIRSGNIIMPFESGPYLSAAFLCERVLIEADGVKSAIRIVDRINHQPVVSETAAGMEPFDFRLFLLLRFKSGSARGPMQLEVRFVKPSGESPPPLKQTVNFEGEDDRGIDIVARFDLKLDQAGLFWFDVLLENERVTRIPLRVVYLPRIRQRSGSTGGPSQQ